MKRREGKLPWYGRLTEVLMPLLGPADVGRQDDAPPPHPVREVQCPLCHHPMSEHRLEQVGGKNRHYCPA